MLILMRRSGEKIRIGDEIKVEILGIQGNHVRIGTHAPRHVKVH